MSFSGVRPLPDFAFQPSSSGRVLSVLRGRYTYMTPEKPPQGRLVSDSNPQPATQIGC